MNAKPPLCCSTFLLQNMEHVVLGKTLQGAQRSASSITQSLSFLTCFIPGTRTDDDKNAQAVIQYPPGDFGFIHLFVTFKFMYCL